MDILLQGVAQPPLGAELLGKIQVIHLATPAQ